MLIIGLFVGLRAEIAQRRVATLPIIEGFNIKEDDAGNLTAIIGKYIGDKEVPSQLANEYAHVQKPFFDGLGNFILQFTVTKDLL